MTRLHRYAEGRSPIGLAFDFSNVVDTATESAPGEFVWFAIEDAKVGICRFRLTASQARAAALGLLLGADTSDGDERPSTGHPEGTA